MTPPSSSHRASFEDEPPRLVITSSNMSQFEDEPGILRNSSSHWASFEDEPSGRALATGRNCGKTTSGIGLHADAAGETPVLHEKLAASAVASAHIAFFPQLRPSREDCSEGEMASGPFHGGQDTIPRAFHVHRPRSWTSSHASFPVGPCAVPTEKKTP